MARLPLLGGSYSPRSIIANCQRCINLYPEKNPQGAPVPITHYQRPGLKPLVRGSNAPVRAIYHASNGTGWAVIGRNVYYVDSTWKLTQLGQVSTSGGNGLGTNPVSMIDNGETIVIADGSSMAWTIDLASHSFNPYTDSTGLMRGADRVDYIDTFLIMNVAGGNNNEWISTLSNSIDFDPTYFAFKTAYPDNLQTLIVNHHNIILIGSLKSEIWFNAGLSGFPFIMIQGAYYEHGTGARYSVASNDISVYFLGQDLQGDGVVWRIGGGDQYYARRVSNHAVEHSLRMMRETVGTDDAIGYCYQQEGHFFYVLHFPKGNTTWVYDDSIGSQDPMAAWHQECWTDPATGKLNRHRGNCAAYLYGKNVCGDWENGTIYQMDLNTYTDTVDSNTCPISWIRTFPHIGTGEIEIGMWGRRPVLADGRRIQFFDFELDLECGTSPLGVDGKPPTVALRFSDDRGRTWSGDTLQTGGETGQYLTWPTWRSLGIARDRVFEVEYAFQGPAALNGAWAYGTVLES